MLITVGAQGLTIKGIVQTHTPEGAMILLQIAMVSPGTHLVKNFSWCTWLYQASDFLIFSTINVCIHLKILLNQGLYYTGDQSEVSIYSNATL